MKIHSLILIFVMCIMSSAISARSEPIKLLVFGDSFAAGYGLPEDEGLCAQLEAELIDGGVDVEVLNAGLSGDTSFGGVARAPFVYAMDHDAVLLELGANDMLRGIAPALTHDNVARLIEESQQPVFLVGIRAFPGYGAFYTREFNGIYPQLAQKYQTGFYPFLFDALFDDGMAGSFQYFQSDRLHPNAEGVEKIVMDLAPELQTWLESAVLLEK